MAHSPTHACSGCPHCNAELAAVMRMNTHAYAAFLTKRTQAQLTTATTSRRRSVIDVARPSSTPLTTKAAPSPTTTPTTAEVVAYLREAAQITTPSPTRADLPPDMATLADAIRTHRTHTRRR